MGTYVLEDRKRFLFMNQKLFSEIQSNFQGFLNKKLHPDARGNTLTIRKEPAPPPTFRVEKIEETNAFGMGNDDDAVGYRITYVDKNGNTRTKLSATPSL